MATSKAEDLWRWNNICRSLFASHYTFIACGNYSNPNFNPLDGVAAVVNSGVPFTKKYDIWRWHYALCAFSAAMWHANFRGDWDLLCFLDADIAVGPINFDGIIKEFLSRKEIYCTYHWNRWPDGGCSFFKREAVLKLCHQRRRPNLCEDSEAKPLMHEEEWAEIFKGQWWNPWWQFKAFRQDYQLPNSPSDDAVLNWPFVGGASAAVKKRFAEQITPLAKGLVL